MHSTFLGRFLAHVRRNVIAYLALFVALGGTGYAASQLPDNSVGTKQLKNKAVTKPKLDPKVIKLFKGQKGDRGPRGLQGMPGTAAGAASVLNQDDPAAPPTTGVLAPVGVGTPPPNPTSTFFTHSLTAPSGTSVLIVNGITTIKFTCPGSPNSTNCVISDGGGYLDGTPIPNTDPEYPQNLSPGNSFGPISIQTSGALAGVTGGSHTFTIGYTGSGPTQVNATIHGDALFVPQSP
jgi:hypothetical protein